MAGRINKTFLVVTAALILAACGNSNLARSPSEWPEGTLSLTTEYGSGGTRLPSNVRYLVDQSFTTKSEVIDRFGNPQVVGKFDWGTVITYRYWENHVGSPRYEEAVDFVFNNQGLLDEVLQYSDTNPSRGKPVDAAEEMTESNKECPQHFRLCKSYRRSSK